MNHLNQPDVAMFDFTCMYASENAALVRERFGHQLLVALVGDSLLEVSSSNVCIALLIGILLCSFFFFFLCLIWDLFVVIAFLAHGYRVCPWLLGSL